MPPRVSLDTSSRASRKVISNVYQTDGEPTPADNTFTSALDVLPRRPTITLRRRGSDGDYSPKYRDSSSHHDKYPSMDSPTVPHPLRRGSNTTARTSRYETGNTRPRLSRVLSPSTPVLVARPAPSPADFPALPDDNAVEFHRTVLAHEVGTAVPPTPI